MADRPRPGAAHGLGPERAFCHWAAGATSADPGGRGAGLLRHPGPEGGGSNDRRAPRECPGLPPRRLAVHELARPSPRKCPACSLFTPEGAGNRWLREIAPGQGGLSGGICSGPLRAAVESGAGARGPQAGWQFPGSIRAFGAVASAGGSPRLCQCSKPWGGTRPLVAFRAPGQLHARATGNPACDAAPLMTGCVAHGNRSGGKPSAGPRLGVGENAPPALWKRDRDRILQGRGEKARAAGGWEP